MPITLMKLQILKRTYARTLPLATFSLGGGKDSFDKHLFFCNGVFRNSWGTGRDFTFACNCKEKGILAQLTWMALADRYHLSCAS